jgi:hypothetical protein
MMKIMLTQPEIKREESLINLYEKQDRLKELIEAERNSICLTNNPSDAKYIIFIGGTNGEHNEFVQRNKIYKKYKKKCFIISDSGYGLKTIKGIYTSLSKNEFNKSIHKAGWYFPMNDLLQYAQDRNIERNGNITCSFRGDLKTHPIRNRIHNIIREKPTNTVIDQGISYRSTNTNGEQVDAWIKYDVYKIGLLKHSYIQEILNSEFILCPRGYNTSSMRVYEVMSLGRVPIIISDNWIRPNGPNWDQFSVSVKENEIHKLKEVIERFKSRSKEMGESARTEWEKWFSNDVYVDKILSKIKKLEKQTKTFLPRQLSPLLNICYLKYFIKSYTLK